MRLNYGVQRAENGGAAVRAIAMLPALTGAWKHRGGGLQLSTSGAFPWNSEALRRPDLMLASPSAARPALVNMSRPRPGPHRTRQNGRESDDGPAVHALFVYNSNPAAVAPNQNAVRRGLARPDLFTVVHEQFFTDTTDYADYRPARHHLPRAHRHSGRLRPLLRPALQQAIEPLGEARSNVWLFAQLAQRMGFPEPCFRDTPRRPHPPGPRASIDPEHQHPWHPRHDTRRSPARQPATSRAFHRRRPEAHPFLPYTSGPFATPSGKVEFYSESLAAAGLDPLPAFTPARRIPLRRDSRNAIPSNSSPAKPTTT